MFGIFNILKSIKKNKLSRNRWSIFEDCFLQVNKWSFGEKKKDTLWKRNINKMHLKKKKEK